MRHWWNNVLGYFELDVDAGIFMTSAGQGVGEIVFVGLGSRADLINGLHENETGRVATANFRPCFWNGGWLYTPGSGPDKFEHDDQGYGATDSNKPVDELYDEPTELTTSGE